MISYNDLCINIRNRLRNAGVTDAGAEARLIVAKSAGKTVSEVLRDYRLYTSDSVVDKALEYTERRTAGEPVAYILGEWEFYGLPISVTPDVLIPRIDTEVIVDAVKEILTGSKMDARILDLCCGSGCIACAVGHEMPATRLVAVDISNSALEICRKNVDQNRLSSRVMCTQADATASPPSAIGMFDMIVCNPPYIASDEIPGLDSSVRDYEPIWALDGGKDGLKFYKSVIKYWKAVLRKGGYLLFEVGEGQSDSVKEMLLSAGFNSAISKKDTAGTERVVIGHY